MEMDGGFERLTSHRPSVFFSRITEDQLQFTPDMKKLFVLTMLISLAMICSCQKQDSAAEQQLAQRKTELDARENALDERLNALDERVNALDKKVKALLEKEQATLSAGTTATGVQGQTPDPAQVTAERDRTIQQFRALIPNPSKVTAGDPAKQARPAPRQLGPEDLQRQWERKSNKGKMSGEAVFPAAEAGSPTPSPAVEASSPTPSPAVEATSPTP
jgi:outer membrane translocation and assembly module TamA